MRVWLPALLLLPLAGCGDKAEQDAAWQATNTAVQRAICAEDREELGFALADVADAADALHEDTRQDAIWQMVADVDCSRTGSAV